MTESAHAVKNSGVTPVKQGSGVALLVINEAMCSVEFGIALVAQNMLGNGLDDPVMRCIWCALQNKIVVAKCVKET